LTINRLLKITLIISVAILFNFNLLFFTIIIPVLAKEAIQVCIKNVCVQAEIADSDSLRQRGLMFREKLMTLEAMLFVFKTEAMHIFWMKNMNIPLDIIWINRNKTVVDIKTQCQPCKDSCPQLIPSRRSLYVLEVSAGFVEKNKIQIGDKVEFNPFP